MREGNQVKIGDVYVALKRGTEQSAKGHPVEPLAQLQELNRYAGYYSRLMHPETEPDDVVRRALMNLQRLKFGVTASFLLNLYDDYANQRIGPSLMAEALSVLENYLLRRFVCGVPTNVLNKFFPTLYRQTQVDEKFNIERLKALLSERGYPSDEEFTARLGDVRLYGGGDRREKAKFILDRLEGSFEHKENVGSPLTIEHIMPQTLSPAWRETLGPDAEDSFEDYLHRLGNLTLTGYNSEMSNAPYGEKRQQLLLSHVELNRYFHDVEVWDFDAIDQRSRSLARRSLAIWPSFGRGQDGSARSHGEVTGTKPTALYIGEDKYDVRDWSDVLERAMKFLGETRPEQFSVLEEDYPHYITRDGAKLRSPRRLSNDYYYEANLSAQRIYRLCKHVMQMADCGDQWSVDTRKLNGAN